MTIRTKFNLIAALIVLPSVIGVFYIVYAQAQSDSRNMERRAGSARTRQWVEQTLSGAEEKLRDRSQAIAAIAIRRDDGVVVFSNARGLSKGENLSAGQLLERVASAYPGADYIAEPVRGKPGGSYIAVAKPGEEPWYLNPYVIGTAFALAFECLFVIVGIVLMLRTSSSILALGEAARRIARGDLAFSLEGKGDDEVTMLYRAFDDMRRELAEAQDSRSRFLMGVSHDLRTPLTSIKGYLQALEEGMAKDPATREKFLNILRAKAELLGSRIQELIEFATLETDVWKANLADLRLRDFLLEIASAAASDAEIHGRKFSSRIRIDPLTVVKADPRLFLRVLENLLSNAMRYTRSGDEVALEAEEDGESIGIVVLDDGPGIPAEEKRRIFDEFYRGTRARNEEGLGLGLAIVKSVVSAHGWEVRLSEDGSAGARFVISIPKKLRL
jgi:signal transduction histidine kinase